MALLLTERADGRGPAWWCHVCGCRYRTLPGVRLDWQRGRLLLGQQRERELRHRRRVGELSHPAPAAISRSVAAGGSRQSVRLRSRDQWEGVLLGKSRRSGKRVCGGVSVPVEVLLPPGMRFVTLSAGWGVTCALNDQDEAYCWGQNTYGQIGDGTTINDSHPCVSNSAVPVRPPQPNVQRDGPDARCPERGHLVRFRSSRCRGGSVERSSTTSAP